MADAVPTVGMVDTGNRPGWCGWEEYGYPYDAGTVGGGPVCDPQDTHTSGWAVCKTRRLDSSTDTTTATDQPVLPLT